MIKKIIKVKEKEKKQGGCHPPYKSPQGYSVIYGGEELRYQ